MTTVATYVEMTDRAQLNPSDVVSGLELATADDRLPLVSEIMARIGAPYSWRSASRSAADWAAWFAEHPGRTSWLLTMGGDPAGVATSTADNPHALPNYHRRGFRTFKTEERD